MLEKMLRDIGPLSTYTKLASYGQCHCSDKDNLVTAVVARPP